MSKINETKKALIKTRIPIAINIGSVQIIFLNKILLKNKK